MLLHKFQNMLSEKDTGELAQAIIDCPDLQDETGIEYYKNSHGLTNLEITLKYVDRFTNILQSVYERPVVFSNSYSRIYRNGSFLGIHTDRPGLDITLSLCVKKEAAMRWPLCVSHTPWQGDWNSNINSDSWKDLYTAITLEEGEGGFIEGIIFPHWRDELQCNDNEKNIYIFYHWTKV